MYSLKKENAHFLWVGWFLFVCFFVFYFRWWRKKCTLCALIIIIFINLMGQVFSAYCIGPNFNANFYSCSTYLKFDGMIVFPTIGQDARHEGTGENYRVTFIAHWQHAPRTRYAFLFTEGASKLHGQWRLDLVLQRSPSVSPRVCGMLTLLTPAPLPPDSQRDRLLVSRIIYIPFQPQFQA